MSLTQHCAIVNYSFSKDFKFEMIYYNTDSDALGYRILSSNEFYIKDSFLINIYNSKQKLRIIYSNKNLSELYKQIKCNNSIIKKCLTVK